MTKSQAIAKGYTHFIEVWRGPSSKQGVNEISDILDINFYY